MNVKDFAQKPIVLPLILILAILIAFLLVSNKEPAERRDTQLQSKTVEVITVQEMPFRSHIKAFGNVEPSISLNSKAEVSGKVSFIHPDLKQGQSIKIDTVVVRIEADDYEVSLKQSEADLLSNRESLTQLEEEEKTLIRSIALAQENLTVGERELARINEVFVEKLVSRSTLDTERQKVISLRQQLEELQGQLNAFASRKDSVKANIVRGEQQVKGQQTNLGRTEISLPFNARVGEVLVEKNEFVSVGETLFEALDVTGVEVNAQLPTTQMKTLVAHLENASLDDLRINDFNNIIELLDLSARVDLVGDMPEARWQANVLRLGESIDPTRRTIAVVVGVDNPYEQVVPGRRPPLLKGMYTQVNLWAPERFALVVPRKALHEGRVFTVSNENTLSIREVDIQFVQNDLVVIRSGIAPGESIIISDIYPVIEGMPLTPIRSELAEIALKKSAIGDR